jgi:hypothetical protein
MSENVVMCRERMQLNQTHNTHFNHLFFFYNKQHNISSFCYCCCCWWLEDFQSCQTRRKMNERNSTLTLFSTHHVMLTCARRSILSFVLPQFPTSSSSFISLFKAGIRRVRKNIFHLKKQQ